VARELAPDGVRSSPRFHSINPFSQI
jgi:hypothetical protein